jgi:chorismate mutase/prephenate dehydratase
MKTRKKTTTSRAATLRPELAPLREGIDACDDQIIALLNKRAGLAQQIGAIKARAKVRAYVPERELQVMDRLVALSTGPLPEESLRIIYKEIIGASRALESPLQIAFLGPEATFTHAACKKQFGSSARLKSCSTIADVFAEVEHHRCEYGVVPIETSSEGLVHHTLETFIGSDLVICAEVLQPVSHHLLSHAGELHKVTRIYAHPEAVRDCQLWVDAHLAHAHLVEVSSTARAVQLAGEDDAAAAIGIDMAASLYNVPILARNLESSSGNFTRFLMIGHEEPAASGRDRTSIMFALKDAPGILYTALQRLARSRINMTRIESRPARRRNWDYLFFIDVDGHRAEPNVAAGLEELAEMCVFLKVLGSYPQGKLPARRGGPAKEI